MALEKRLESFSTSSRPPDKSTQRPQSPPDSSGNIDDITVKSKPRDARQCGIATVLTELCLLDPDVYREGKSSDAYNVLRSNGIDTKCEQAVAMDMVAEPLSGAYAYFSAASRTGYNKLVVNWPNSDYAQIAIYDTDHAKQAYNKETGIIEPCVICQNTDVPCEAFQAKWIFCKECAKCNQCERDKKKAKFSQTHP